MCILPRTQQEISQKALEQLPECCPGPGGRGCNSKIGAIIQHEQQRSFWQKLNYFTGKNKTHSATSIQVEREEGAIFELSSWTENIFGDT
jgi:hypothetical protein